MARARSRAQGFTLIEILVVVTLLALLSGLSVLALRTPAAAGPEQYAGRSIRLLRALRDEAVFSGKPLALGWHNGQVLIFDRSAEGWQARAAKPGSGLDRPEDLSLSLLVEGVNISLFEPEPSPQILFTADAQISAFILSITSEDGREVLLDQSLTLTELQ